MWLAHMSFSWWWRGSRLTRSRWTGRWWRGHGEGATAGRRGITRRRWPHQRVLPVVLPPVLSSLHTSFVCSQSISTLTNLMQKVMHFHNVRSKKEQKEYKEFEQLFSISVHCNQTHRPGNSQGTFKTIHDYASQRLTCQRQYLLHN